jgi:hypothetical protein
MIDAGRLLAIMDERINKRVRSAAGVEITYGQVYDVVGNKASVYLHGSRELSSSTGEISHPIEDFRIPTHLLVEASDYVRVSMDIRGHRWIDENLSRSPYGGGSGSDWTLTVEELDGIPSGDPIERIVFPNDTITIDGTTATYTPPCCGTLVPTGDCSITPTQIVHAPNGLASLIDLEIDAPAPGDLLIAIGWGRGLGEGGQSCTDNGTGSWTEHTDSPFDAGDGTATLVGFTKIASGDETTITIVTGGSGNKCYGAVFVLPAGSGFTEISDSGSSGSGTTMVWDSGTFGSPQALLINAAMIHADDISTDYAATVDGGATLVAHGTINDNFNPGYILAYDQDVTSISGTWNHWPQSYVSLAWGITCESETECVCGTVARVTDGVTTVEDPLILKITGANGIDVTVSETPAGTADVVIDGSAFGLGKVWKPVVVNAPNIVTTDGTVLYVPLVTNYGEPVMVQVPE